MEIGPLTPSFYPVLACFEGLRGGYARGMGSQHTVADNIFYDLVSIQYHALKGAEVYDRYIEDAHEHDDVVEFIRRCKDEDNERAKTAHELLGKLTKEGEAIG